MADSSYPVKKKSCHNADKRLMSRSAWWALVRTKPLNRMRESLTSVTLLSSWRKYSCPAVCSQRTGLRTTVRGYTDCWEFYMLYICVKTVLIDSGKSLRGCGNVTHTCLAFFHALPKVAVASLIVSTGQQGCATEDLGYENMNITCPNQVWYISNDKQFVEMQNCCMTQSRFTCTVMVKFQLSA